jgi:hypothetical protein
MIPDQPPAASSELMFAPPALPATRGANEALEGVAAESAGTATEQLPASRPQ